MRPTRKQFWPVAALVAAVGLSAWFLTRSPFQRVLELPSGHVRLVANHFAVVLKPDPSGGTALRIVKLDGGREYEATRVGPDRQLLLRGAAAGNLYYWIGRPLAPAGRRFGLMGAVRVPTGNSPSTPKVEPKPKAIPAMPEFTVRRAHLDGGASEEVLRNEPSAGTGVAAPEGYYWVRVPKKPSRPTPLGAGELMLSPTDGSPPRKLAERVLPKLEVGEGGVYWPQLVPGQQDRFTLRFLSADGKTRRVVKNYSSPLAPQVVGDRIYWIAETRTFRPPPARGTLPLPTLALRELVSADRNGEHRRVLLKLAEAGKVRVGLTRIQAHGGRLYGLMWETSPPKRDGEPGRDRTYLCEIRREGEPVLRKLCELPGESVPEGFFDGDSFYFIQQEMRENWRDWTRGKMSPTPVEVLYRFRLPH